MALVANLSKLLDDTHDAAYWLGFLTADGSFVGNRLKVTLANKDLAHAQACAEWLDPSTRVLVGPKYCGFTSQDSKTVPVLRERFDLQPRKTYNPPRHMPYRDIELLFAWLIGYIDGDGSVTKPTAYHHRVSIWTTAHASWRSFLEELATTLEWGRVTERVVRERTYVGIGSRGWEDVLRAKHTAATLPSLKRKWDRVDDTLPLPGWIRKRARALILEGLGHQQIAQQLGCSPAAVSGARKSLGLGDGRRVQQRQIVIPLDS